MKLRKIALISFAVVGVGFLAFLGFLGWMMFHLDVMETKGPVPREKATECPISLPPSAQNIQYAWVVGGMQYTQQYVRFEAPVEDCKTFAQQILADSVRTFHDVKVPKLYPTDHPIRPPTCPDLHTNWFDVDTMPEGLASPEGSSHVPQVWVDTKRGIFYYYVTD